MKKNGYTLVEMMIVVAVLAVLGGMIYIVISQGKDAAESVDVRAQLTQSARTAMTEIIRDLSESNSSTVTISSFPDPLNGESHQILVFALARGNPAVLNDDPLDPDHHTYNDYVHLDADHRPVWRSVIVYCTYVTPEGIQQLRKYVDYNNYSGAGVFTVPWDVSVTADTINLQRGGGLGLLQIARNSGSARANYITSEITGPANNNDGVIDNGADFTLSGSVVEIKLFLSKRELPTKGGARRLTMTLDNSVFMRN